jgi:hypothetical protein
MHAADAHALPLRYYSGGRFQFGFGQAAQALSPFLAIWRPQICSAVVEDGPFYFIVLRPVEKLSATNGGMDQA